MSEQISLREKQETVELWKIFFKGFDVAMANGSLAGGKVGLELIKSDGRPQAFLAENDKRVAVARPDNRERLWHGSLCTEEIGSRDVRAIVAGTLTNLDSETWRAGRGMIVSAPEVGLDLQIIQVFPKFFIRSVNVPVVVVNRELGRGIDPLLVSLRSRERDDFQYIVGSEMLTAGVDALVAAMSRSEAMIEAMRMISEAPHGDHRNRLLSLARSDKNEFDVLLEATRTIFMAFEMWQLALRDHFVSVKSESEKVAIAAMASYLNSRVGGAFIRGFGDGDALNVTRGGLEGGLGAIMNLYF